MRPSDRIVTAFALSLLALGLPFCGGRAADSGSSESHFLATCDAKCGPDLECVCGVCTERCESDATCRALSESARCMMAENCGPEPVCGVACSDDTDCADLGAAFECRQGQCRSDGSRADADGGGAVATGGGGSGGAATTGGRGPGGTSNGDGGAAGGLSCSAREMMASQSVSDAIQAADRSCETSADCSAFDNSSGCHYACGAVASNDGAQSVQTVIDGLNGGLCATFADDGCTTFPPPCPFPGFPACVDGECIANPGPLAGPPCSSQCGNECYVPGTGENPICSQRCTTDEECGPAGLCQAAGGTGSWCFHRCTSNAECQFVNDSAANPLFCTERTDASSSSGFGDPYAGSGDGFCIQTSEP